MALDSLLDEIKIGGALLGTDDVIGRVSGTVNGVLGGNLIGNLLGGDPLGDIVGGDLLGGVLGGDLLGGVLGGDLLGDLVGGNLIDDLLGGGLLDNLLGNDLLDGLTDGNLLGDLLGGDLLGDLLGGGLLEELPGGDLLNGPLGDLTGLLSTATGVIGDLEDNGIGTVLSNVEAILGTVVDGVVALVDFAGPLTDETGQVVADIVDAAVDGLVFSLDPALLGAAGLTDQMVSDLEELATGILGDGSLVLPSVEILGLADALVFVSSDAAAGDINSLIGVSMLPGLDLPLGGLYESVSALDEALNLDGIIDLTLESGNGLDVVVDLFDTL